MGEKFYYKSSVKGGGIPPIAIEGSHDGQSISMCLPLGWRITRTFWAPVDLLLNTPSLFSGVTACLAITYWVSAHETSSPKTILASMHLLLNLQQRKHKGLIAESSNRTS